MALERGGQTPAGGIHVCDGGQVVRLGCGGGGCVEGGGLLSDRGQRSV